MCAKVFTEKKSFSIVYLVFKKRWKMFAHKKLRNFVPKLGCVELDPGTTETPAGDHQENQTRSLGLDSYKGKIQALPSGAI